MCPHDPLGLLPALAIDGADGSVSLRLNQPAGDLQLLLKDLARRIRIVFLQGFDGFLLILRVERLLPAGKQRRKEALHQLGPFRQGTR